MLLEKRRSPQINDTIGRMMKNNRATRAVLVVYFLDVKVILHEPIFKADC